MSNAIAPAGILDAIEGGIVLLDPLRRIRLWNAWIARAAGIPASEAVGRTLDQLLPSVRGTALDGAVRETIELGLPHRLTDAQSGRSLPLRGPSGEPLHHSIRISPLQDGAERCCLLQVQDESAHWAIQADLRRSEEQARARLVEVETLYHAAPIGLGLVDRDLRFLRVNAALADINGHPVEEHLGRSAWDVVPELREVAEPLFLKVFETGEPLLGIELQGTTQKTPGARRSWVEDYYPLKDPDGQVVAVGAIVREVTEQKRLEEREALLRGELQHRLKNAFSMVGALVGQTARSTGSLSDFVERFNGRLQALADAQTLLVASLQCEIDLRELIEKALSPFMERSGRLEIRLQSGRIAGDAAADLALALHELATNATKYGALSTHGGRVTLTGGVTDGGGRQCLRLEWREADGPTVTRPDRYGFGVKLLQAIARRPGGQVDMDWHETGLICHISLPAAEQGQ